MSNKDLNYIKKHYGEQMMHMCRVMFPRILENEGELSGIISTYFAPNHHLAEDIVLNSAENEFADIVFSFSSVKESEKKQNVVKTTKSAVQLMDEAGYVLYPECQNENDIQEFKKYYANGEELCTFRGGRLDTDRVWFAVKKNLDNIKRAEKGKESRQDEYGTSVISIQFGRGENSALSIKNRYNHTVNNPDNTFKNNLDNIISGLTDAFEKDYGVKDTMKNCLDYFELPNYVLGSDNKYYPYNIEKYNIYFCENNIIIDGAFNVIHIPTDSLMLVEDKLFDFKNKKILNRKHRFSGELGDFVEDENWLYGSGRIKNMIYSKKDQKIIVSIENGEDVVFGTNNKNQLVSYTNTNMISTPGSFLTNTRHLREVDMPNVEELGSSNFLGDTSLEKINMPKVRKMASGCFIHCDNVKNVEFPKLRSLGECCFYGCEGLEKATMPQLQKMENESFVNCKNLKEIVMPKNVKIGKDSFYCSPKVKFVEPPRKNKIKDIIGKNFLKDVEKGDTK